MPSSIIGSVQLCLGVHGTEKLPSDRFSWNFFVWRFSYSLITYSDFNIRQKCQAYMHSWSPAVIGHNYVDSPSSLRRTYEAKETVSKLRHCILCEVHLPAYDNDDEQS